MMNGPVVYELNNVRKALDRLADALGKREVHPDAAGPAMSHLHEMSVWLNNFATGLTSLKTVEALQDFLLDNPPPPRSPDLYEHDDDDDGAK
jgi:hypothetical protein